MSSEGISTKTIARFVRQILFGKHICDWIFATGLGTAISICIVGIHVFFLSFEEAAGWTQWLIVGLDVFSFMLGLIAITVVYSYRGGGLIDCCLLLILPLFISFSTFLGITPIWEWSQVSYFVPYFTSAIFGAFLWGGGLGTVGFVFGIIPRITYGNQQGR